ncbi:MAG TPA: hypothetical protein VGA37_02760 [Gemmatimonadales bacterium]
MDPSKSIGTPTSGSIDSAINVPNLGTMYVEYLQPYDTPEMPDWGVRALINVIEGAGRRFEIPLGFPGACRILTEWNSMPRMQVGHLSLQAGGAFIVDNVQRHVSHQSGVDVDVRYLRTDGFELPLNLAGPDSLKFDLNRTVDLMRCLMSDSRVVLMYYDSAHTGIVNDPLSAGRLVDLAGHSDHFHVRVRPN